MKTSLRLTIAAFGLAIFTVSTFVVQAQFNYTTTNGTVTITRYTGPGGAVTIPGTITGLPVTSIGDMGFYNCTSLTNVTIPNGVTSIGNYAFCGCTRLTNVTISDSVISIGSEGFSGCSSLTKITIPNSVTSIGSNAFLLCTSLSAITVDTNNPAYSSVDGVMFNKNQTTLIRYPEAKAGGYTIPNSVTSIGDMAFYNCTSLTNVTIPNGVTSIGNYAFCGCTRLTNVTIPNSATSIGEYAFEDCSSLTSVTIPQSVTSIGDGAFSGCSSLTSVTIPQSATSIGDWTLAYCYSLTTVTLGNIVTSIGDGAFTRAASSTGRRAKSNFLSVSVTIGGTRERSGCDGQRRHSHSCPLLFHQPVCQMR